MLTATQSAQILSLLYLPCKKYVALGNPACSRLSGGFQAHSDSPPVATTSSRPVPTAKLRLVTARSRFMMTLNRAKPGATLAGCSQIRPAARIEGLRRGMTAVLAAKECDAAPDIASVQRIEGSAQDAERVGHAKSSVPNNPGLPSAIDPSPRERERIRVSFPHQP